ncbi:hypothetical protein [Paenibacillus sp. Root444D2]|uniref:hypothetical protein n=1 Tax=Paenibacillus sp. Root444D2 TaxID=1736538 RepID=UPI00070AEAA9|nr:hypothetical protein [Paenibacillus sp. Root444D2]KQX53924.1 hypothetical protein ASD40_34635 [Paenibacillus sp. Root444D2]
MSDRPRTFLLFGIFICLIIIAMKPVPQFSYNAPQTQVPSSGESVVQLSENRIAIVDTNINSGMRGEVFVLEFDETKKTFNLVGRYNYVDFFRIPNKYIP